MQYIHTTHTYIYRNSRGEEKEVWCLCDGCFLAPQLLQLTTTLLHKSKNHLLRDNPSSMSSSSPQSSRMALLLHDFSKTMSVGGGLSSISLWASSRSTAVPCLNLREGRSILSADPWDCKTTWLGCLKQPRSPWVYSSKNKLISLLIWNILAENQALFYLAESPVLTFQIPVWQWFFKISLSPMPSPHLSVP